MSTSHLNGTLFCSMIQNGTDYLYSKREVVNDLNVFPIPDGDTGDNMYMTLDSGLRSITKHKSNSLKDISEKASKGMLLGARGNSGVILSRIFAGISSGFSECEKADASALCKAFSKGVSESYNAVSKPVEGTILTVFKDAVSFANKNITDASTINSYFDDLVDELKKSLDRTPEQLPILKEAGVVDSGGAGLVYIIEGMRDAINGKIANLHAEHIQQNKSVDISSFTENSELKYGYCTEFLLQLLRSKIDIDKFDFENFKNYLTTNGNSVVAFKEGSIVKVHIHSMTPGNILSWCQQFGEFLTVKIENMTIQHNETTIQNNYEVPKAKPHKKYGLVSVATGNGIKETFLSLGTDYIVDGGQSMNPSAEDFIKAFDQINADTIIVFPNNGNVILTAKQAASLYKDKNIVVFPSKNIGDGYAAISMIDTEQASVEEIISGLEEAIDGVVTGFVSQANRSTEQNGVTIIKNDYIGFVDDTIYVDCKNSEDSARSLCCKLSLNNYDVLLLIYGNNVSKENAEALSNELIEKYPNTEIILIDGGQPIYNYILILE